MKVISLITFTFLSFYGNSKDIIHKISMSKEKIIINDFNYSITKILDQRLNRFLIGSVQKGLANKRFPADFENNLPNEFGTLITNSNLNSNKSNELVIIINSLWIDERTSAFEEIGLVDLDFYIAKTIDSSYVILDEQDISTTKNTFDATSGHSKRIAEAIEIGLNNFNKLNPQKYLNEKYLEKKYNKDSTIAKCKCIKKGIFNTSADLLHNETNKNKTFFDKVEYTEINASIKDSLKIKEVRKIFAFSDGIDIYINSMCYGNYEPRNNKKMGYQFGKAKLNGTLIIIDDKINDMMGKVAMTSAFGLLGALASSNMKIEAKFFMDLRKGAVLPLKVKYVEMALEEFPELLQKFKKSRQDDFAIIAFLNEMNRRLDENSKK